MSCEILSPGKSFSELWSHAWSSLRGKWGIAVGSFFLANLLIAVASNFIGGLAQVLLAPLSFGATLIALRILREEQAPELAVLFEPFSQYVRCVWGVLRPAIFIFLWSLLLVIPGIIAAYRYFLTVYILLDHPEMSVKEAMAESCRAMYGHKLRCLGFTLLLSLISIVVVVCTLFIGLFWLVPFYAVFWAAFYESVKRPAVVIEADAPAELEVPAEQEAVQPESEQQKTSAGPDQQA